MGVRLSKKYGVNPTIPVCFWCGSEKNEVALMGHIGSRGQDIEAPMRMVLDYEPCEECKKNFGLGFTVIEATEFPNTTTNMPITDGVYPTGRFVVIKPEAAKRIFKIDTGKAKTAFMKTSDFRSAFMCIDA